MNTNKNTKSGIQINDPFSSTISSSIFSCICILIFISIIATIFRYSMAAIVLTQGDVGAATSIMSPNAYGYRRNMMYNQQPVVSLNL